MLLRLSRSSCWAAKQCCCDRSLLGLTRIRRRCVDASVSRGARLSASLVCCCWTTLKVSNKEIKQKQHSWRLYGRNRVPVVGFAAVLPPHSGERVSLTPLASKGPTWVSHNGLCSVHCAKGHPLELVVHNPIADWTRPVHWVTGTAYCSGCTPLFAC